MSPSEPEPLLASEDTVDPPLLVGAGRVEGGQGLSQLPEAGVVTRSRFGDERLERLGPAGAEQDHRLMNAVEDGRAGPGRADLVSCPGRPYRRGNILHPLEEARAGSRLPRREDSLPLALAEEVFG